MKAIFIDRDGVINKDPGGWTRHNYVTNPHDLQFLPGALKALKILRQNGIKVIVVSNQAGVAKGYFTIKELDSVNRFMLDEVIRHGGAIEDVYYCTHRDEDNCACRKPKSGLLEKASRHLGIDPAGTYIIGDVETDMIAGKSLGAKTILVLSGKATLEDSKRWQTRPDYVFKDLLSAVDWIAARQARRAKRAVERERKERPSDV